MEPSTQSDDPHSAGGRLRECHGCGLVQALPALPRRSVARCGRCHAVLRRRRVDPHGRALAMALTGLLLFGVASQEPFMQMDLAGRNSLADMVTGPVQLSALGAWPLAVVVLGTTLGAPLLKLLATIYVLLGIRRQDPPRHLRVIFRWVERLSPWSMVEVFLLGAFVAYTKLIDIAHVEVGPALFALGGLMLTMALTDAVMDDAAVWDRLMPPTPPAPGAGALVGCGCCKMVSRVPESGGPIACARCGETLHRRIQGSLSQCWALMLAATVLFVPANVLPVLNLVSFGQGRSDTIMSGVVELGASGMWPLAALVFFASILVPVLKLAGMSILLISTQRRAAGRLAERTLLYRVVEAVGRWSMIDVFMISILTALVRLGALATITPGPGAICFCGVVVLTMIAAMRFDPRLMWDAERRA